MRRAEKAQGCWQQSVACLQIGEGGLHLLGGLQLGALRLLLLGQDRLHRADQALPLQLEPPPSLAWHARASLANKSRLRCREGLRAVAVAEQPLLELLHRGVLEQADLLHEHRLEAPHDRAAKLLRARRVQRRHVSVSLWRLCLELVEGVGDELVGLGAKGRHRLTARHALAQRRNLALSIRQRGGGELIASVRRLKEGV